MPKGPAPARGVAQQQVSGLLYARQAPLSLLLKNKPNQSASPWGRAGAGPAPSVLIGLSP